MLQSCRYPVIHIGIEVIALGETDLADVECQS